MPISHHETPRVRISTDLEPAAYRFLITFCGSLAVLTGRPRVPHSLTIRTLVGLLEDDEWFRAQSTDRLTARLKR